MAAFQNNSLGFPSTLASKATPVGADIILIADSAAGNALKQATISSLPFTGNAGAGWVWVDQASSTVTMVAGRAYIVDNGASLVTLTLPASAALGDSFKVVGKSAGGWTVALASGQSIRLGNQVTTTTTGSLSSSNQWDIITIYCITANTVFTATPDVGNITFV